RPRPRRARCRAPPDLRELLPRQQRRRGPGRRPRPEPRAALRRGPRRPHRGLAAGRRRLHPPSRTPPAVRSPMNHATTNQLRILVIEDETDLREGLQHNLEHEGYAVDTAADGREGLHKALTGDHSLILLDLMLPGLDGLEVLRRLRSEGRPTAVIVLSARGQDRDKVAGLELGADDYLTKPVGL